MFLSSYSHDLSCLVPLTLTMLALWELYAAIKEGVTVTYHLIFTQNCQNKWNEKINIFNPQNCSPARKQKIPVLIFTLNWKVMKSLWCSGISLKLVPCECYGLHLWLLAFFYNLFICFTILVCEKTSSSLQKVLNWSLWVLNEKKCVDFVS